mmetsp:Transcript_8669/g.18009  ORF Transcript_8669/g.18009 Transcript_8669/m.18009 type:complete len:209 (-) Transcript_8669:817-1443(-)
MRASNQAAEQTPDASNTKQSRRIRYTSGFDKKATGKDAAMIRHAKDPTTVVMIAPRRPVLKNVCSPSGTPKIFSPTPTSTSSVVRRAITKVHSVTKICRPIKKACRLLPLNANRHVDLAILRSASSFSERFTTAKSAICMPSIKPAMHMSTKKTITEITPGTLSHAVVFPSNNASRVTAKEKANAEREKIARPQKNMVCTNVSGGSFD